MKLVSRSKTVVRWAGGLTALWMAVAAPAWASLDDPLELLGRGVPKAIDTELQSIGAARFEVEVVPTAPEGVTAMAKAAFAAHNLAEDQVFVLVAFRDREAGVAVGKVYSDRGVTDERLKALVKEFFKPLAARDLTGDAILALVREIKMAKTLGPVPGHVPPPPPMFPWLTLEWLAVLPVLGVGAAVALWRQHQWRKALRAQRDRLLDLRGHHGMLVSALRDLKGQANTAADGVGATAALGEDILARREALKAGDRRVAELIEAVLAKLEAKDLEGATAANDAVEREDFLFEAGLAGLRTAARAALPTPAAVAAAVAAARALVGENPAGNDALAVADRCVADEDFVGALDAVAEAVTAVAGRDPDDRTLAMMLGPSALPDLAETVLGRWQTARDAQEKQPEAKGDRDRGPSKLGEVARLLTTFPADLARIRATLDAQDHLTKIRVSSAERPRGLNSATGEHDTAEPSRP